MKNKVVDLVCLCVVAVMFGSVALLNLIQPSRPTESLMEKRTLAEMPAFSLESLADGSFFSGTSLFVSDTFLYRDRLVALSKQIDTLRGVDYALNGEENFVLLGNSDASSTLAADEGNDDADQIAAALDDLLKNSAAETEAPVSGEEPSASEPEDNTSGTVPAGEITDAEPQPTPEPPVQEEAVITLPNSDEKPADTPADTPSSPEPPVAPADPVPAAPADENKVTAIYLSKNTLKLTVGSGAVLSATVDSTSASGATVKWSVSDKNIASIAMNPSGGIDVKGLAEGTCTVTCSYGEGEDLLKQQCEVTVTAIGTANNANQENLHADFLPDGLFIYGDAVYTQAFYSEASAKGYAQTAAYYKTLFGENTRVSVVVAPVSSMVVDNAEVQSKIPDQKDILDKMAALMDPSVNFVDAYTELYNHRDEYLFFKSDHHWTARGAYYAYTAFAKSIGLEPTALDGFDYGIRNDSYHGSMYSYTYDARVQNFVDTIEAFFPRKAHTMTVTGINGTIYHYDTCIVSTNSTYVTFIAGDNPYTVINVPDNPQDFNVLVLKDSFGNAFIPYLCEHYGNIIVVDTRYFSQNLYEQLGDYGLSDIIFVNNIQAANSTIWYKMYMKAVGVNLN
ncbi:MAG: DHHW family protein [Eubacteriales bacterium]